MGQLRLRDIILGILFVFFAKVAMGMTLQKSPLTKIKIENLN